MNAVYAPRRPIPLRQIVGAIILALIALYGYQQLTTIEPPTPAALATELEKHVNETAAFEGRLDYVRATACKSNGGNFFLCRAEHVGEDGEVSYVSWSVETTDGHMRATPR